MKLTKENVAKVAAKVEAKKVRGAWNKGVKYYAGMLCEKLADSAEYYEEVGETHEITEKVMLNGASDWAQYSCGGCALIYDGEIAETLCSPSELKRCDGGNKQPNSRETWLDVQARALRQAARLVLDCAR